MALALDGSSPVAFKATPGTSITSASFTPPAGSLIRFCICDAYGGATDPTMSSTGGGLGSWRQVVKKATGAFAGANCTVYIYEAPVNSSVATTVKADFTATGSFDIFGFVYVWTGQAASQTTAATGSGTASGSPVTPFNSTGVATTANNSRMHGIAGFDASGTLGSSDSGSGQTGTNDGTFSAYKAADTATSGTSVQLNYTNTGNPGHVVWVTAEILAGTPPPGQGTLSLAGLAPTLINTGIPIPGVGTLALAGLASLLNLTMPGTAGTGTFQGYAPTVSVVSGRVITPASGSLTLSGSSVNQGVTLTPSTGSGAFVGAAPSISLGTSGGAITPIQADMAFAGYAVSLTLTLPPIGQADMALVGYAPFLGGSAPDIPTGSLGFQGYAPLFGSQPGVGSLSFQGQTVQISTGFNINPTQGSAAFVGYAPSVAGQIIPTPTPGSIAWTGQAPTLVATNFIAPGILAFTGYAPSIMGAPMQYHFGYLFPIDSQGRVPTVQVAQALAPYTSVNGILLDSTGRVVIGQGPDPAVAHDALETDTAYLLVTTTPTLPLSYESGLTFDANGYLYVVQGVANPQWVNGLPFDPNGALVID